MAAILGACAGAGGVLVAVKEGSAGPAGKRGPQGARGPAGDVEVAATDVQAAIDEDPGSVAASLSGFLDSQDIQQNPRPESG